MQRVALHHADPAKRRLGRELQRRHPPNLKADAGLGRLLRDGRPQLYPEISDSALRASARNSDQLRLLRELGMRSAMILPLRTSERILGALTLAMAESQRGFDENALAFAQDIARRAAVAVENARRQGEHR